MSVSSHQPQPERTLTPALLAFMWVATFGFGTFFMNYATLVAIGVSIGLTTVVSGAALTAMMIAVVVVQPLAPRLSKRMGPRYALLLALGLQACGNLLTLLTHVPVVALVTGSIVGGLGFGLLVVIGTAVVPSTVAPKRLGKALGYFGTATTTATAIGAPAGLWLIEFMSATGFRWITLGLLLIALPALVIIPQDNDGPATPTNSGKPEPSVARVQWAGLLTVLLPAAVVMMTFGVLLAFGPAASVTSPATYIISMQVFAILGRFVGSASLDRYDPVIVMNVGIGIAVTGILFSALLPPGWTLITAMVVMGCGIGTVQAASLVLCFVQTGSTHRGSVAWNMTFDVGLGLAGLVGGLGFTYWGAPITYILSGVALTFVGLLFAVYFLSPRRQNRQPLRNHRR